MLQQLPAWRLAGKHAWHKVGAPVAQLGLKWDPSKPLDPSSREAKQKDKPRCLSRFHILSETVSTDLADFSTLSREALWMLVKLSLLEELAFFYAGQAFTATRTNVNTRQVFWVSGYRQCVFSHSLLSSRSFNLKGLLGIAPHQNASQICQRSFLESRTTCFFNNTGQFDDSLLCKILFFLGFSAFHLSTYFDLFFSKSSKTSQSLKWHISSGFDFRPHLLLLF